MDKGTFVRPPMDKSTTLGDLLVFYKDDVTAKRPGSISRQS